MLDSHEPNAEHIVKSYIDPIRSVILVDDRFPSYSDLSKGTAGQWEKDRATALWTAYRGRNWACEIESSYEDSETYDHVTKHDLLILDYHLNGEDFEPALKLLRKLVGSPHAHLVVLYTRENKLPTVLRQIATYLRGVSSPSSVFQANSDLDDLWNDGEWSIDSYIDEELIDRYLRGGDWKGRAKDLGLQEAIKKKLTEAKKLNGVAFKLFLTASMEQILKQQLLNARSLTEVAEPTPFERMSPIGETDCLWIWHSNLFVTLAHKDDDESGEGERLVIQLQKALVQAQPSPLELTMAYARNAIHRAGFQVELNALREPRRQAGWWYHVLSSDQDRRAERLANLADCLLTDMIQIDTITEQVKKLCGSLLRTEQEGVSSFDLAKKLGGCSEDTKPEEILHAVNEFLCSETFSGDHVRLGTILQDTKSTDEYLICVSPACDMVPREPNVGWLKAMHPVKPFWVIAAKASKVNKDSFVNAEQGRDVYITDRDKNLIIYAIMSDSRQPNLEILFASDSARVASSALTAYRVSTTGADPSLDKRTFRVVSQLRTAYATRLLHAAGSHLSRIGVNFLRYVAPEATALIKTTSLEESQAQVVGPPAAGGKPSTSTAATEQVAAEAGNA